MTRREWTIIISDLHLAAGPAGGPGPVNPTEPFVHDAACARLLDLLRGRAATDEARYRLLVLGDLFDLPRVLVPTIPDRPSLDASDAIAIAKVDRIANGHPVVFAALGRWLGAGLPIVLVPGNHDSALMSTPVQRHLCQVLSRPAAVTPSSTGLTVYPWIYHLPGLLYAEHGHQYHDINSFPALVRTGAEERDKPQLPLGAALDAFVVAVIGKLGPDVDDPDSLFRLIRSVVRTDPRQGLRVAPDAVRLVAAIGRHIAGLFTARQRRRREAYRLAVMPEQADATGLPAAVLGDIDRLAEESAHRLVSRMVRLLMDSLRPPGLRRERGRGPSNEPQRRSSYLYRAAADIHRVMAREGRAVPFYVFGHTHAADQRALNECADDAVYLNSGSWAGGESAAGPRLTFVAVEFDSGIGEATASLMRWNDADGQIESVMEPASGRIVRPLARARSTNSNRQI